MGILFLNSKNTHTRGNFVCILVFIFTHNDDDLQQTEYYYKGQLFFVKSSTRFILEQVSRNLNDDTRFFFMKTAPIITDLFENSNSSAMINGVKG